MTSENGKIIEAAPRRGLDWPLDPRRALRLMVLKSKEIVLFTLGVTFIGVLFAFLWPPTYEGVVVLKLPTQSFGQSNLLSPGIQVSYPGSADNLGTFTAIAQSVNVAEKTTLALRLAQTRDEFKNLSQQEISRKLFHMVTVDRFPASSLLQVQARSHDPRFAADLANAWAQAFMSENLEISHKSAIAKNQFLKEQAEEYYKRIQNPDRLLDAQSKSDDMVYRMIVEEMEKAGLSENEDDAGMVIVTPAVVPEKAVFPRKSLTILAALLLGLAFGIQWAFLSERSRPIIRDERSLFQATDLAPLASVPDCHGEEKRPSDFKDPPHPLSLVTNPKSFPAYSESIRLLGTALALTRPEGIPQTLGIFSPGRKEGRTLLAANLALELARSGRRVLLVDADLQNPAIGKLFNISTPEGGLPRLLEGTRISGLMVESGHPNLWLLANPLPPSGPGALLQPGTLDEALQSLKKNFDLIVFDTSPVLSSAGMLTIAARLDGALVLAHWDETPGRDLARAVARLRAAGAPLLGAILNGVHRGKGLPKGAGAPWGRWLWEE